MDPSHGHHHGHGPPRGGRGPPPMSRQEAQRRLKESVSGHRTGLPRKLLDLFAPRPAPQHLLPLRKKKPNLAYTGVAQYLECFADPGDAMYEPSPMDARPKSPRTFRNRELAVQARVEIESKAEKKERLSKAGAEKVKKQIEESMKSWNPHKEPKLQGDPYKTLFVARISFDVSDKILRRYFEEYGPIKQIKMVHESRTGKFRGYAFIEYEHKADMKDAYKSADGLKIEGRRVVVDVERGRTVDGWRPRRLAGGLGGQNRVAREPGSLRDAPMRMEPDRLARKVEAPPPRREPERELDRSYRDRHRPLIPDRFDRPDRERMARDHDHRARRRDHEIERERHADHHRGGRERERERERLHENHRERGRERDRHDRERRERKRSRDNEDARYVQFHNCESGHRCKNSVGWVSMVLGEPNRYY